MGLGLVSLDVGLARLDGVLLLELVVLLGERLGLGRDLLKLPLNLLDRLLRLVVDLLPGQSLLVGVVCDHVSDRRPPIRQEQSACSTSIPRPGR